MRNKEDLVLQIKVAQELEKRKKQKQWQDDFEVFGKEMVRIVPKDVSQGFIPLDLNPPQKIIHDAIEKQRQETGKVRVIVLKARQQGISTYFSARTTWRAVHTPLLKATLMAHEAATSDALFDMSRNIISNMPEEYRPSLKNSNAKALQFEHNNAQFNIYTAGNKNSGRGTTATILHASEVAFWNHDKDILGGLFQGVSDSSGTEVIIESTANGAQGEFYRLWQGAMNGENEFLPVFIPWFATPQYRMSVPEDFEITHEEDELKKEFGLDDEQIYWRRMKVGNGGIEKFKQEYPATPEEAFVVSGNNVFDVNKVRSYVASTPKHKRQLNLSLGDFQDVAHGELEIWKAPSFDDHFVLGVDVAQGVGQDYSTIAVMNRDKELCALWRSNMTVPGEFGDVCFYLGRYYNNGLMIVEQNGPGLTTITRLQQMNYTNLYYAKQIANTTAAERPVPGFRTTQSSKPHLIAGLTRAVHDFEIAIPSNIVLDEMLNYIVDDKGKMGAISGKHDDTVIATALCLEALRTHADRLSATTNWMSKIPTNWEQDESNWL